MGVYYQIWRYGGIQAYIRILIADGIAFVANYAFVRLAHFEHISLPWLLSISAINLIGALSMRMTYRYAYKCATNDTFIGRLLLRAMKIFAGPDVVERKQSFNTGKKVAIIGAGRVGITLAEELTNNPMSNYSPVCFIDIDSSKTGREIHDIPVIVENDATISRLKDYEVSEVIVAVSNLTDEQRMGIYSKYKDAGFKLKVYDVPTVHTATGKRQLREFDVEELLFRKPVIVKNEKTAEYYKGKKILITGGGGSIGSEIVRQLMTFDPAKVVILDVYENGAYEVQQDIRVTSGKQVDIEIMSICNRDGMYQVFAELRPDIVIMAAAHKHVPLMERNVVEAIHNNIFGTLNTVELAVKYEAERVIMVSTDKAVNPTNVMGATKRFCEMIVGAYSKLYDEGKIKTTFSSTRFGNVLGSAGSVIPLFKKQIANGGPITITHKDIIRYFMTIPEASSLVLESGAMARNGELFVLDMGQPVKIYDLAVNMIQLAGFTPDVDIKIEETGLRPGEKLYEELLIKGDNLTKTDNKLIFIESDSEHTIEKVSRDLGLLSKAVATGDNAEARKVLHEVVPTYVER